jgi:hypothetical protein
MTSHEGPRADEVIRRKFLKRAVPEFLPKRLDYIDEEGDSAFQRERINASKPE